MQQNKSQTTWTVLLVASAVIFGMVLAGGTELVPASNAEEPSASAVKVSPSTVAGTLPSFADLAEAVSPAVVLIQATKFQAAGEGRGQDPFEFFFGPRRQAPPGAEPEDRRSDSGGSGFLISADGLVVTNHHVIEDASEISVFLGDREYPAEIQGDDPATDIALLKIETDEPLTHLALGSSHDLRVGDWIMAIGSPFQLTNSVSVGVVSAKGRGINITPDPSLESFIQTDAAINFGNSGGPIVNLKGEVVGIATAINAGAENIGFAVPVATLHAVLPQLKETGMVRRGFIGVQIQDLTFDRAEAFGLESTDGVLVTDVNEDGPAENAGVQHGDVIVRVDDQEVASNRDLIDYVSARPPGTEVKVDVMRDGERKTLTVELGERPGTPGAVEPEEPEAEGGIEWMGMQYQNLTPGLRASHGMPESLEGVFVTDVAQTSPLWEENVRPGDVIIEVNRQAVSGVGSFEEAVEAAPSGSFIRLYVERYNPRLEDSAAFFAIVRVP